MKQKSEGLPMAYILSLAIAEEMLRAGVLPQDGYIEFTHKLAEKYGIIPCNTPR